MHVFDASIDLVPGLTGARRVTDRDLEAVRTAVEVLPGARWISVAPAGGTPDGIEWLTLYAPGRSAGADAPEAGSLRRQIETVVRTALRGQT